MLVLANVDNVPDCPEVLNARGDSAASLSLPPLHQLATTPDFVRNDWLLIALQPAPNQYVRDLVLPIDPFFRIRLRHQAADPSPPAC